MGKKFLSSSRNSKDILNPVEPKIMLKNRYSEVGVGTTEGRGWNNTTSIQVK